MKKLAKLFTVLAVVSMSSGCILTSAAKYTTDSVCSSSEAERTFLKEKVDTASHPNKIRVYCNAAEETK